MGLVIQKIEPNGRVSLDGRLKVGDLIIQINKKSLIGLDFGHAQEILKEAIQCSNREFSADLEFKVVRKINSDQYYESNDDESSLQNERESIPQNIKNECNIENIEDSVSPQNNYQNHIQQYSNNVKGKLMTIQLIKGPQGLGFTLACRDNYLNDDCSPIYIKNILPNGAAIADGRLQRGDRLLEINKMDMTKKTLIEVVNILRKTKLGTFVELVVSRQIMNYNNNCSLSTTTNKEFNDISAAQLPREMHKVENNELENNKNEMSSPIPDDESDLESKTKRKLLIFDIPLNDTGSAGLGVSVKGKTKRIEGSDRLIDLGIFVKTVIHGGAASKDGRLKANDQLINLNGISLLGKENEEAMFLLREAMQFESKPGHVQLTVSRKIKNKEKNHQIHLSKKNASNEIADSNCKLVKNSISNSKNSIASTEENEPSSFAFNRDAPSRRSMSSKRSFMGGQNGMAQSLTSSNICKFSENQSSNSYNHKRSQTIDNFSLRLIKNYQNSENKSNKYNLI
jgi:partitioning defective protein 3